MSMTDDLKKSSTLEQNHIAEDDVQQGQSSENTNGLHRRVGARQVQLFAIGGSIGTALFVSIGSALYKGGPVSLVLAFTIYSTILGLVNNCVAEMTVMMPVEGGFVRLAGHWVDEAFGFMVGINFFCYEAIQIPFEITALNVVLSYWRDDIPIAAVCVACIVLYGVINLFSVKYYGEAEFWLSSGKVLLVIILFCFTFVTMVGGNPHHDAYGFRNWSNPAPFNEWISTGSLGKFQGFLECLWFGALMIVGPEYISMIAGETKHPRRNIKSAFKTVYWRFGVFFIGGAICVATIVSSRDETLANLVAGVGGGSGTAAASPYVIAMKNFGIEGLPHLINALLFTSIFSAGNTYCYVATRNLYGLALDGQAPKFLLRCTKNGVPVYCFAITMLFPFLSLLQLSNSTAQVLDWLVNLMTSGGLINFIVICVTYLRYYQATKVQKLDRDSLPYKGWFQPYSAWIALVFLLAVLLFNGYMVFLTGAFTAAGFLTKYTMVLLAPFSYLGWKMTKQTKFISSQEVDLVWQKPMIDAYEAGLEEPFTKPLRVKAMEFLSRGRWTKSKASSSA